MHSQIFDAVRELGEASVYLKNRIVELDVQQKKLLEEFGLIKDQFVNLTSNFNTQYAEITEDLNQLEEQHQQPASWNSQYSYTSGDRVIYNNKTFEATDFVHANETDPETNDKWLQVLNYEGPFQLE